MPTKTPSLYRSRHGVFYLRVCLPKGEQQTTNKKEIWRSLRTKDAKIARGLALRFAIEKNDAMPSKSPKTILEKITNPLRLYPGGSMEFDLSKAEDRQEYEAIKSKKLAQAPSVTDAQRIAWQAQEIAQLRDSELAFRVKELEAQREREAHLKQVSTATKKIASPLFSKYAVDYLALIKNSQLNERTKKAYASKLKVFQDFTGKSATLADITPEKVLDFQTWLAKDDPVTDRKAITPRSIDEYSNVISNGNKKFIKKQADNPIEGRLVSKKQRMKSNRKPFTPDELTRIFDPERLHLCRNPADFFFPILGLLTGSRPSSICQLRLGDIRREDGINVFSYHDYLEGNSAKTSATNRIVPVHPLLEKIGFLRYLEDIKSLPDTNATTLIFPWLNQYEQGFADVPSQNFREVLKRLKIYVHNVKVPYSLRHTTNQRMKERGVPEDFRSQYIGHENDSVNNITYGGITPPKFLLERVIPKLNFDEIKWDAIHYQSARATLQKLLTYAAKRDQKKKTAKI